MLSQHTMLANKLLEFVLPYPGEKDWSETLQYLDISALKLDLFITEIEHEKPGWLYKTVGENDQPLALGIREEMQPEILHFLSEGGFEPPKAKADGGI